MSLYYDLYYIHEYIKDTGYANINQKNRRNPGYR